MMNDNERQFVNGVSGLLNSDANFGFAGKTAIITLLRIIERLSEEPPVVHARWTSKPYWTLDKCSNCGKNGFPEWPYCPGCGARMDADHA